MKKRIIVISLLFLYTALISLTIKMPHLILAQELEIGIDIIIVLTGFLVPLLLFNLMEDVFDFNPSIIVWPLVIVVPITMIVCYTHASKQERIDIYSKLPKNVDAIFSNLKYDDSRNVYDTVKIKKGKVLIGTCDYDRGLCKFDYKLTTNLNPNLIAYNLDSLAYYIIISKKKTIIKDFKYEDGSPAYTVNTNIRFINPKLNATEIKITLNGYSPGGIVHKYKPEERTGSAIENDSAINFINYILTSEIETMKDDSYTDKRDGKAYKIVKIGNQCILAENFAFKPIKGEYKLYNNKSDNLQKYGYLYDFETAKAIIPSGWHLPSQVEWENLINELGGSPTAFNLLYTINSENIFVPSGGWFPDEGSFVGEGKGSYCWSSTKYSSTRSYMFACDFNTKNVTTSVCSPNTCLAVRLFRNIP